MSQYIIYEQHNSCPVCGSKHFAVGQEHQEILQTVPFALQESHRQAIVHFTPALCFHCGLSFNVSGLSNQTRAWVCDNYQFIKPSSGVFAQNFKTYVNAVAAYLKSTDDRILDIGGYDGYLLRQLAQHGYHNLTLVDPSPQTEDLVGSLHPIRTVKGFFPQDDEVFKARQNDEPIALYDVVGSKDVLQMVPDPLAFMRGINEVLKLGGMAIIGSAPLNLMHPLQNSHLGPNFYYYLAQNSGFKLIKRSKPSYYEYDLYELQKVLDWRTASKEQQQDFAAQEQQSSESFEQEQQQALAIINSQSNILTKSRQVINEMIAAYLKHHQELIIYGTGHHTFNLLSNIDCPIENLTLVNSTKDYAGRFFLMPNGKQQIVKYAPDVLTNRHVPLLVLGVLSEHFKNEILELLKRINCTYDQLLYLPDIDQQTL